MKNKGLVFREDSMYGTFPTYEEIVRDYNELIAAIKDVTTIEQVMELEKQKQFTIEINTLSVKEFIDSGISNDEIEFIRYEAYGCLAYIYCNISDGKVKNIAFDVWSNGISNEFIENVTFEQCTKEFYDEVIKETYSYMSQRLEQYERGGN